MNPGLTCERWIHRFDTEVVPCTSLEEAKEVLKKHIEENFDFDWPRSEFITAAKRDDVFLDKKYIDALTEYEKKNATEVVAEAKKDLKKAEKKLAQYGD